MRSIAWIYVDEKCIDEEILKACLVCHYKTYSKEQHLVDLEDQARKKKLGLSRDAVGVEEMVTH